jgi:hypothetical protein
MPKDIIDDHESINDINEKEDNVISGIKTIKFTGVNFSLWKIKILSLFDLLNLTKVIEEQPSTSSKASTRLSLGKPGPTTKSNFSAKSIKAFGVLVLSLHGEPLRLIQDVPRGDAYSLWQRLLQRYECKTTTNQVHLRMQLHKLHMEREESFEDFISKIAELTLQIEETNNEKISESELLCILYDGLPNNYAPVIQALKVNCVNEYDKACEHIRNFYNELKYKSTLKELSDYNDEQVMYVKESGNKRKLTCYTCGKPGHVQFDCEENKDKKKCSHCRKLHHIEENCWIKHPELKDKNNSKLNQRDKDSESIITDRALSASSW